MIVEPSMADLLGGADQSDSITFDVHKWFSAPMATSMLITNHRHILSQTFNMAADYMPKEANEMEVTDPYAHSIQWSRRFIGLKLYMSLLVLGWDGLAEMVRSTTEIGNRLKSRLRENGWEVLNDTELPIACFVHPDHTSDPDFISRVCLAVVNSGKAWISIYNMGDRPTLRACITNYATGAQEIEALIELLEKVRRQA